VRELRQVKVSDSRKIVIQKTKFKGKEVMDIRTFIETPSYSGYTRKGINIPIEVAPKIAEAILEELTDEPSYWTEIQSSLAKLKNIKDE